MRRTASTLTPSRSATRRRGADECRLRRGARHEEALALLRHRRDQSPAI